MLFCDHARQRNVSTIILYSSRANGPHEPRSKDVFTSQRQRARDDLKKISMSPPRLSPPTRAHHRFCSGFASDNHWCPCGSGTRAGMSLQKPRLDQAHWNEDLAEMIAGLKPNPNDSPVHHPVLHCPGGQAAGESAKCPSSRPFPWF